MLAFGTHLTPALFQLSFFSHWKALHPTHPFAIPTTGRYLAGICKTHRRGRPQPLPDSPSSLARSQRSPCLLSVAITPFLQQSTAVTSAITSPGQPALPPFLGAREPDLMFDTPNVLGHSLRLVRLHSTTYASRLVPFTLHSSPLYPSHLPSSVLSGYAHFNSPAMYVRSFRASSTSFSCHAECSSKNPAYTSLGGQHPRTHLSQRPGFSSRPWSGCSSPSDIPCGEVPQALRSWSMPASIARDRRPYRRRQQSTEYSR